MSTLTHINRDERQTVIAYDNMINNVAKVEFLREPEHYDWLIKKLQEQVEQEFDEDEQHAKRYLQACIEFTQACKLEHERYVAQKG